MRRIRPFWILVLLMGQSRFSVLADPPIQLPNIDSREAAQEAVAAPVKQGGQVQSSTAPGRLVERFRRPTQSVLPQDATKTLPQTPSRARNQHSVPEPVGNANTAKSRTITTRFDGLASAVFRQPPKTLTARFVPAHLSSPFPTAKRTRIPRSSLASVASGQSISLAGRLYQLRSPVIPTW